MTLNSENMVSWKDYGVGGSLEGHGEGFGSSSTEDVRDLMKALSAGSAINNPGTAAGEGFPLRVESLDRSMKYLTYTSKHIRAFKQWPKAAAFNTVEEYNALEEVGSQNSAFITEGGLPEENDSTYSRQYSIVKFLGTTRRVTHPMALVRPAHGNVIARETVNGTLWLLKQIESALFQGNSDIIPEQFDGLETLMVKGYDSNLDPTDGQYLGYEDGTNVIDMRGAPLTEDSIEEASERVYSSPNFGLPTSLWLPPSASTDISRGMLAKERFHVPGPVNGKVGIAVNGITTPYGDIGFEPNVFLAPKGTFSPTGTGSPTKRPNTPILGAAAAVNPAPQPKSLFTAASDVGDYLYWVTAVNRYGESAPLAIAGPLTVALGDTVTLTVKDDVAGPAANSFRVYRTKANGAVGYHILDVAIVATGVNQAITDINRFLPDTARSYLMQQDSDVLGIKMLSPMVKVPLATVDSSIRWMQLCYLTFQLYAPRKALLFTNVGRL